VLYRRKINKLFEPPTKPEPPTFCTNCEVTTAEKGVTVVCRVCYQKTIPIGKRTLDALIKGLTMHLCKTIKYSRFHHMQDKEKDATETTAS